MIELAGLAISREKFLVQEIDDGKLRQDLVSMSVDLRGHNTNPYRSYSSCSHKGQIK